MTASNPGIPLGPGAEFDLIRAFLSTGGATERPESAAGFEVRVGPGDDCAIVALPGVGRQLAISTDISVEDVHFRRSWLSGREIGYRAAAAALSDLAAVAAIPAGVLVSLAAPSADVPNFATEVMAGVREAAEQAGATLLGGDVARSPSALVLDVTVVGLASTPVLRRGGGPGDEIWVTGELGAAAAAVESWARGDEPSADARAAYARPNPRVREARWLAERGAMNAAIDLSDGLAGDLRHLSAASDVALVVQAGALPVHPAALAAAGPEEAARLALAGGEDYELCFLAPADRVGPLVPEFEQTFGVRLNRIGSVERGAGVFIEKEGGERVVLETTGYVHFGGDGA